jgi:hypothetical protein
MRFEVIRANGDLKREVWVFSLSIGFSSPCIYLDHYSFQTRLSIRHKKWEAQTHWNRLDRRGNNVDNLSLPTDVESEMRAYYQQKIMEIPIVR